MERTLYDINVEIDALDRELRSLDRSDLDDLARGRSIVEKIRALEEEYRTLRASTPRNYEGL